MSRPGPGEPVSGWRAAAYGLELSGEIAICGLSQNGAAPGRDALQVELQRVERLAPPSGPVTRIAGAPEGLMIESDRGGAHRMSGAGMGRALIEAGGAVVSLEAPGPADPWLWNRWVLGQVLPFVAALRGVEQLHAGAVVLDQRAVAILGPSGAGKSTLVAALVDQGGAFLADDVVAVQETRDRVLAHPGPGLLAVGSGRTLTPAGPAPLTCVCSLEAASRTSVEARPDPDPRTLLSNVYERVRRDPKRLENQLWLLAKLANQANFIIIRRGPDADPPAIASRLIEQLRSG